MKREARKTRRARRTSNELDSFTPLARLALIAGDSLALSDNELTDAMNALSSRDERDELADVLHARLLELVELLRGLPEFANVQVTAERARLEQRRGAGFVQRVRAMGQPAEEALTSHKIQTGQLLARAVAVLKNATWWSATLDGWLLRSTSGKHRRLSFGRRFARTSSRARARGRRSLSGSITRRSTRTNSKVSANQSSPSDGPPGKSSDHRTHPYRPRHASDSSTARAAESSSAGRCVHALELSRVVLA